MSDISANIVVETSPITIQTETNPIGVTVEPITLNVYNGGFAFPGGTAGELQYNGGGIFAGIPTANYINGNLSIGNVANLKILGGVNGYVLQTDGTGNLSFTAQSGGGGNGTPGGANTQVQYNNAGSFGGSTAFTFNETSNLVSMAGNLDIASFVNTNNINVTSNLTVNNISNLGNIGNVKITGGSNTQIITTDGIGNLSFTNQTTGFWSNAANIQIGGIVLAKAYGISNYIIGPGNTISSNVTIDFSSFANLNAGVVTGLGSTRGIDGTIYGAAAASNVIAKSSNLTTSFSSIATTLLPRVAPIKGSNNLVIFASSTNRAAYSTDLGNTWANATLPNSGLWQDIAYGNGVFIIATSQFGYNKVARSTNEGVSWTESNVDATTNNQSYTSISYGNGVFIMGSTQGFSKKSTDNGATWSNISLGTVNTIAYGNGKFVGMKTNGLPGAATVAVSSNDGNTWTNGTIANYNWYQVAYSDPYFIASEALTSNIAYSTDGINWSYDTIPTSGGYVGCDTLTKKVVISDPTGNTFVSVNQPTTLFVTSSDGNASNVESVATGTYRNLGGITSDAGALWIRIS